MKILHLARDYPFTAIYNRLISHLLERGQDTHTVYVPLAHGLRYTRRHDLDHPRGSVVYQPDYHRVERVFYARRGAHTASVVRANHLEDGVDLVHAHTLLSTGAAAWRLYRECGVPYVVTIRASDLTAVRCWPPARKVAASVLRSARAITCPSHSLLEPMLRMCVPAAGQAAIRARVTVIPNGIDDFWFLNPPPPRPASAASRVNLLFVGEPIARKRVEASVAVTRILRERGRDARLLVVGSGRGDAALERLLDRGNDFAARRPWTSSREELAEVYRAADAFVMLSWGETFGLVYIEALSQGTPAVFVRGEAIDGFFPDGQVGYACPLHDEVYAANCVERILAEGEPMRARCIQSIARFRWTDIAAEFAALYEAARCGPQAAGNASPAYGP